MEARRGAGSTWLCERWLCEQWLCERARPASCLPPYNKCGSVRLECRERRSMTRTRTESDADRVRRGHRVIRGRGVHWSEKRGRTLDSGLWSTPTHNMKHPRHHAYELTTSRSRRSHVRIGTTCAKAEPNTPFPNPPPPFQDHFARVDPRRKPGAPSPQPPHRGASPSQRLTGIHVQGQGQQLTLTPTPTLTTVVAGTSSRAPVHPLRRNDREKGRYQLQTSSPVLVLISTHYRALSDRY